MNKMNIFGENYAKYYDFMHTNSFYTTLTERLIDKVPPRLMNNSSSILDFGCGTGNTLAALKSRGFKNLFGYDVSKEMLSIAQSKLKDVAFYNEYMKLKSSRFDIIFSLFDVLSYQASDNSLRIYLKQISQLLTDRGLLILDGWFANSSENAPKPTNQNRPFSFFGQKLFREIKVHELTQFHYTLDLTIKDFNSNVLFSEVHNLKAYSPSFLGDHFSKIGLETIEILDAQTFEKLTPDSFRFIMFLKRK